MYFRCSFAFEIRKYAFQTLIEAEFRVPSKDVESTKIAKRIILSGFDPNVFDAGQASLVATTFNPPAGILDQLKYSTEFFDTFNIQCDKMWQMHREMLLKLEEEKYDIIMSEQLNLCGVGLQAALKIKTNIWISSCPLDDHMAYILGVPTPLSYVPAVGEISVSDQMSLYERLRNILEFWKNIRSYYYGMHETDKIYQKYFGSSFPSVIELARNSALTFVLADEFLDFPRPILHSTIYVGGLGLDTTVKPTLSNEYELEMKKGQKGVIFFSFGTNVETTDLPKSFKIHFFEAMKHFQDYHFIVKFNAKDKDAEMEARKVPNCKLVDWAPQPAILAHNRLSLFITHGGYNSLLESVNYAKPLLLMPIFGDQWRNAMLAQRNGFGLVFEKRHLLLSSVEFVNVLNEMLTNSRSWRFP
uniref:UDP-glucuronosyltransferase n=1 Tax=Panagrolaimus superbus TaxID=310955 RepID=A0A914YXS5_9BILA